MNPTPAQMRAVVYLIVFIMTICAARQLAAPRQPAIPDHTETKLSGLFVELSGETGNAGIYYLPLSATQGDLMKAAEISGATLGIPGDIRLKPAQRYHWEGGILEPRGLMAAEKRLLLGLRLDINRITKEELMLIPRIGPKTAAQIMAFKEGRGELKSIDELKEIKGIKEKRLEIIKKHLTAGSDAGR